MPDAIITAQGKILAAKLLKENITHLAVGSGDGTFTDPMSPPAPSASQEGLVSEKARVVVSEAIFVEETADVNPDFEVNGEKFNRAGVGVETNIIAVIGKLRESDGNGITIKEYGFFGGGVTYRPGVSGDVALNGVYDAGTNPTGEVDASGYLYEVQTVPDFPKTSSVRFEIVGIIKV